MKKFFLLLLVCLFVVFGIFPLYGASPTTIVLTIGDTNALVNGDTIQLDVAPFIEDGRTFVPLRFVLEQLGGEVTFDTKPDGTVNTITMKMGIESSSPDTLGIGVVGQRVVVDGAALTVVKVTKHDNFGFKPKEGYIFLNAEVIVENISRQKGLSPFPGYSVKDSDNFEYNLSLYSADPSLKGGNLLPREKSRGNIAFEVPINAFGFVLKYQPGPFEATIKVDLGL